MQHNPSELFISYKREAASTKLAKELKAFVEEQFPFLKVVWDEEGILMGENIRSYMDKLTKGDYIIFLISPEFLKSQWCMYELALTAGYKDFKERVFPIIFPGTEIKTARQVTKLAAEWSREWKDLKHDIDALAANNPKHATAELKEELDRLSLIAEGTSKALLHVRETKGWEVDGNGEVDFALVKDYLKKWIKLPLPVQKILDDMVPIPAGKFKMGSEEGRDNEKPIHEVSLSTYHISKYPVTQAQWQAVMGNNPSHFKGDPKCPVEKVSWNDCQQFIGKLNGLTGLNSRLPTEAEWEYAALGGNKSKGYKFAGSDDLDKVAWNDKNSGYKTHPVGLKTANELGLYDMSGNVWEWCQDWYSGDYYKQFEGKTAIDPKGPEKGDSRVVRGGAWNDYTDYCRVSNRFPNRPDYHFSNIGVRLARD